MNSIFLKIFVICIVYSKKKKITKLVHNFKHKHIKAGNKVLHNSYTVKVYLQLVNGGKVRE